jgi:hypothetical protein
MQQQERPAPTVKLRLAAIRCLFAGDRPGGAGESGQVGARPLPTHVVTAAKTLVLARVLIDSIEVRTVNPL